MKHHKATLSRGERGEVDAGRSAGHPTPAARTRRGRGFYPDRCVELRLQGQGRLWGPGCIPESHRSHTWPWLENSLGQPPTGPFWGQGAPPMSDLTAAFTGCPPSGTRSAPGSFHPLAQQQPRNHQAECPLGSLVRHLAQRGAWATPAPSA